MRKTTPAPTQDAETAFQLQLMQALRLGLPAEAFAFHVPNQGKRSRLTGLLFKAMGMKPGMTDLVIVVFQDGRAFCAFLELKVGKNPLSKDQRDFRDLCSRFGAPWAVAYDLDAALSFVSAFLAGFGLRLRVSVS